MQVALGILVTSDIEFALILTFINCLNRLGSSYKFLWDKFFFLAFDINKCATCKNIKASSNIKDY